MTAPIFSLCYTSRRANDMARVLNLWFDRAANPSMVEIILSVDEDYPEGLQMGQTLANYPMWKGTVKFVKAPIPGNCVKGWNRAAEVSTGKVLLAIADDFQPPQQWDVQLLQIHPTWTDLEAAVKISDGYNKDLCTLGIITRKRYERFGWLFYPGYLSIYSDTELTYRAIQDNVLIKAEGLIFEHIHPDAKKRARDAVDLKHSSQERYATGEQLFNYRHLRGFPTDVGPVYERMANPKPDMSDYAAFCLAVKDDFCLYDVIKRVTDQGIKNVFFAIPNEYWSGVPTPQADIDQVTSVAEQLKTQGIDVRWKIVDVAKYRQFKMHRAGVETCVRNEALSWIRDAKFDHVIIVDGDELWRTGLLAKLDALIRREHPVSVMCRMIPVIGLPGLPIREAKDKVTIYMRSDTSFRECRSPFGLQTEIPDYDVIHFSATRKSMDEIVDKMRASGHADDPSYDFDGFIKHVLPNVKPGSCNLHMYKHYQIWPSAGLWSQSEMDDIPPAMRPYLSDLIGPEYTPQLAQDEPDLMLALTGRAQVATALSGPASVFPPPTVTASHPVPSRTSEGVYKANPPSRKKRRW